MVLPIVLLTPFVGLVLLRKALVLVLDVLLPVMLLVPLLELALLAPLDLMLPQETSEIVWLLRQLLL
jgi:hypothetical protein